MGGDGDDRVIDLKRRSVVGDVLDADDAPEELTPELRNYFTRKAVPPVRNGTPPQAETAKEETKAAETQEPLPSLENLSLLPKPGDDYKAYGSPQPAGSLPMLVLLDANCRPTCLSYGDLRWIEIVDGKTEKDPPVLLLRFIGIADVGIEGGNMTNMVGYLYLHRLPWLRTLPPGKIIADKTMPVITNIAIREIKK